MQRKILFTNGESYHVYNRGVDKRAVFLNHWDYERFLVLMYFLNTKEDGLMAKWQDFKESNPNASPWEFRKFRPQDRLVELNCYCLNENHYHFILKQLKNKGIETFMQKLGTAHSMYFNKKYVRSGSLFQGPFKAIHIDNNEYFLYLSAYINKNHSIHGYKGGDGWKYSSFLDFIGKKDDQLHLCNKDPILKQFKNVKEYEDFIKVNALYMKEKKETEKYLLE
jgi:putative transposase